MSSRIKRNAELLKLLSNAKPGVASAIIKGAPPDLITTLCECSLNVLKGNVRMSPAQKRKLARHKINLRTLAQRRCSAKKRKQILQKGGFLGALLKPVLGTIFKLFAS
jgi:hypothetical protein